MSQILIIEQSLTGSTLASFPMDLGMSRTTLRELIRRRVYEEVVELRAAGRCPLVAPGDVEAALNEPRPSTRRVDWEVAADLAVKAFHRQAYIVTVGDRQITEIDEEFDLGLDTPVAFVRLTPMVGG